MKILSKPNPRVREEPDDWNAIVKQKHKPKQENKNENHRNADPVEADQGAGMGS